MNSGLLLIDKTEGTRSTDCVGRVRRALGGKQVRVGHAGTLDSTASGLLVLLVGRATRLSDYVMRLPKVYRTTLRLGQETDTCDYSGRVIFSRDASEVKTEDVDRLLPSFWGWRMQRPPEISALKLQGVPAHRLARSGQEVALSSRPVFFASVKRMSLLEEGRLILDVSCSKGTYVRSLVRDLGSSLGCGAHVESLRRLSIGPFSVEQAISLPEDSEGPELLPHLSFHPLRSVGQFFRRIKLNERAETRLLQGRTVPLKSAGRYIAEGLSAGEEICVEGTKMFGFAELIQEEDGTFLKPRTNILFGGAQEKEGEKHDPRYRSF